MKKAIVKALENITINPPYTDSFVISKGDTVDVDCYGSILGGYDIELQNKQTGGIRINLPRNKFTQANPVEV